MFNVYYNAKSPGSFGGVNALYRELKGKKSYKDVKEWLSGQDTYTLHKPVPRKFLRNRIVVNGIDDQYQIDLADVSNLSRYNSNVKFLLTCIDVFSKYAWAIPLKNKKGETVKLALEQIFHERKPRKVQSDKGKEFINKDVQLLLKENGIKYFTSNNPEIKCSIVERFNRTLKNQIWHYLTYHQTFKFIHELPNIMYSYNNRYHRSIKMKPSEVTSLNEKEVWQTLFSDTLLFLPKKYKFNVGDYVRISLERVPFRKGYKRGWTEEIFKVIKKHDRYPVVYNLSDLTGDNIEGTFYEKELQKVVIPTVIVKKKRRRKWKRSY